jgi:5'-nucleotidase
MDAMSDEPRIALFDMDGTLCDYEGAMSRSLDRLRSPIEPPVDRGRLHGDVPAWLEARMSLVRSVPGWWENLPRLQDGFDILELAIRIGFEPQILTKGPATTAIAWSEKLIWCQKNLPHSTRADGTPQYILTHIVMDKAGTYGRMLTEDYPPYVERWLKWRKRGLVVLLDRPYNRGFEHPQVVRYDGTPASLELVRQRMQAAFDRPSGAQA